MCANLVVWRWSDYTYTHCLFFLSAGNMVGVSLFRAYETRVRTSKEGSGKKKGNYMLFTKAWNGVLLSELLITAQV